MNSYSIKNHFTNTLMPLVAYDISSFDQIAPHKLAPCSKASIFIGYTTNHHGYCCYNLITHNVIILCHVLFYEIEFPFRTDHNLFSTEHIHHNNLPTISSSTCSNHHYLTKNTHLTTHPSLNLNPNSNSNNSAFII